MAQTESLDAHDPFVEALERARALLEPPMRKPPAWSAVAAAALFAVSAMAFATAAILAPPQLLTPGIGAHGPA